MTDQPTTAKLCDFFWGSHGCDLLEGHISPEGEKIHLCGGPNEQGLFYDDDTPCSQYDEGNHRKRSFLYNEDLTPIGWEPEWSDWSNAKGWYMHNEGVTNAGAAPPPEGGG